MMLGGMFAGHDQCAGEVIEKNGKKVKLFYGMSSDTAMKKHLGGVAEYRYKVCLVPPRGLSSVPPNLLFVNHAADRKEGQL